MCHQLALQAVGKLADDRGDIFHMPVEHQAQPVEFLRVTQIGGGDDLVEPGLENAVGILGGCGPDCGPACREGWFQPSDMPSSAPSASTMSPSSLAPPSPASSMLWPSSPIGLVLAGGLLLAAILVLLVAGIVLIVAIVLGSS